MLRISEVKCRPGHTLKQLRKKAADILHIQESQILTVSIVRQSLDARKKPDIFYSYTIDVEVQKEDNVLKKYKGSQVSKVKPEKYRFPESGKEVLKNRPIIVGMGPAGLFCGYFLALHGYCPILLERGADVEQRSKDVEEFWEKGILKPNSNVQFGEGGAGTFSDGKLNTLVKEKKGRNKAVLEVLVQFGAKEGILYEAKPHIGTDVLKDIVKRIREEIIHFGGEVYFHSQVTELLIEKDQVTGVIIENKKYLPCSQVVLAIGHSARDTFEMLYKKKIPMEAKSFAVGLRVEHLQTIINKSQYGSEDAFLSGKNKIPLGAASYKLTASTSTGRGVYSFCMCPGGYVVNASSEQGKLAVNGMSYSGRNGKNANSAIIVTVTPKDYGLEHPLAGIAFQRMLEEKAYQLGNGKIPVQRYGIFRKCIEKNISQEYLLEHLKSEKQLEREEEELEELQPENKGKWVYADVSQILPRECNLAFIEGMEQFGKKILGFNREDTLLSGVESRTSSPVRILRGETMQSEIKGLYPCGEGAGYAGGITSAAMDGICIAEAIAQQYQPFIDETKRIE